MKRKYCVILGSGESVNLLTSEQRQFINSQPIRIGLNKFGAYYKKSKITPTHIYFTDIFSAASRNYLKLIFNTSLENKLDLTYILNKKVRYRATKSVLIYQLLRLLYFVPNLFFNHFKTILLLPKRGNFEYIGYQKWDNSTNTWANSLNEDLYHFKGSLSTVFNYCALKFGHLDILLVGVDFNGSKYFFQEELDKEHFVTTDRTTEITQKENKHFSLIPTDDGLTFIDKLPYMLENLSDKNIDVQSISAHSRLVQDGFIKIVKS